jgi:serine/threonine-protein kinase
MPVPATTGSPLSGLVPTPMPTAKEPTGNEPTVLEDSSGQPLPEGASETSLPTQMSPEAQEAPTVASQIDSPSRVAGTGPVMTPGPGAPPASLPGGPIVPGSRFGQRYEVVRHLGRGGMGDVYEVNDTRMNRRVALKTIRPDKDLEPQQAIEMRQRFYREARTGLTHPNVVTVHDVGEDLGMSYIVMEFVEGDTLTKYMKAGRLNVAQIKHVIFEAAQGLQHAHENGIFHRDVKPDNIMVTKKGVVKVMDFGIARTLESDLTKTGSVLGTPSYMSPEQVSGLHIDARSDVFSLGVILYELLTGRKPFSGETVQSQMFAIIQKNPADPSTVDANVASVWDEILRKALAKDLERRYQTAAELGEAVKNAPVK